jgi:hypothetical protein
MTINVRHLIERLREVAAQEQYVGMVGLLIEEAVDVITNQQADLEALRRQGADHT